MNQHIKLVSNDSDVLPGTNMNVIVTQIGEMGEMGETD